MKIAIQAADLDSARIDGTRVYLLQMLNHFGKLSSDDEFFIYHKNTFNPELTPQKLSNYKILAKPFPFYWTQTRFALELWKNKFDRLWMPMHSLPFLKPPKLNSTVTIHDLAFKYFPEMFPYKDLRRLNLFTDFAVKHADKLIAVSESTKRDILKFYPRVKKEKIRVIYHGFDRDLFQKEIPEEISEKIYTRYDLKNNKYILYVGAIQPRKNLETLISAFELAKKDHSDLKLILAGGKAWMWQGVFEKVECSPYGKDIIITGSISFQNSLALYKKAALFVFPSFYEGFGIPVLEAMASDIPVICAHNSSLPEVGGNAVCYFDGKNIGELAQKIKETLSDEALRKEMIEKGRKQIQKFSWEKCAQETLNWIKY